MLTLSNSPQKCFESQRIKIKFCEYLVGRLTCEISSLATPAPLQAARDRLGFTWLPGRAHAAKSQFANHQIISPEIQLFTLKCYHGVQRLLEFLAYPTASYCSIHSQCIVPLHLFLQSCC